MMPHRLSMTSLCFWLTHPEKVSLNIESYEAVSITTGFNAQRILKSGLKTAT